jgi:hypothetical protein
MDLLLLVISHCSSHCHSLLCLPWPFCPSNCLYLIAASFKMVGHSVKFLLTLTSVIMLGFRSYPDLWQFLVCHICVQKRSLHPDEGRGSVFLCTCYICCTDCPVHINLLLDFTNAAVLGPEPHGTHYHTLLSDKSGSLQDPDLEEQVPVTGT